MATPGTKITELSPLAPSTSRPGAGGGSAGLPLPYPGDGFFIPIRTRPPPDHRDAAVAPRPRHVSRIDPQMRAAAQLILAVTDGRGNDPARS